MWFFGLIVGGAIGAIGGAPGFFLGAILGAGAGAMLAGKSGDGDAGSRIAMLEDAVRQLNERLKALEGGAATDVGVPSAVAEGEAPLPPVPEVPQPLIEMPLATPEVAAQAPVLSRVESEAQAQPAADTHGAAVEVGPAAPEATAARLQKIELNQILINEDASDVVTPAHAEATTAAAPADAPHKIPAEPVPAVPSALQQWWQRLIGGNIVAKVGVIVLFFGVSFLLKYAYDHALLPVPLRLGGVACAGLAMLVAGWRLIARRPLYGLILQGCGIGVLYLDVFFALKVFSLLDPVVAFGLFMLLGVAATLLAVRQDAKVLAVLGLTGAFLAPVLASRGDGSHVLLFSYYTLLNSFILLISWFKSWRDLNLTGFIFTFIVALAWGERNYTPDKFASVEPFVLIFFVMYLVIPIVFATRQPPQLKGLVDGTLVFGTPLAVSFMQASLVHDMPNGLAWSAGVACALYALLAVAVIQRDGMRLLGETFIALSVVFGTLALFFALDAYPTFALWTLEGAAIVWVGLRQRRLLARVFGYLLQVAGAGYFLLHYATYALTNPWFNDFVLGCVLIAVAGFVTAGLMHKHRAVLTAPGQQVIWALLIWAALWWTVAGVHSTHRAFEWGVFLSILPGFFAASFLAVEVLGVRWRWPELRHLSHAHVPVLALIACAMLGSVVNYAEASSHPLAHAGIVTWPLSFALVFWVIRRQVTDELLPAYNGRYHATWILIGVLATWEGGWLLWHKHYWIVLAGAVAAMAVAWFRFARIERASTDGIPYSTAIAWWAAVWWFCGGFGQLAQAVAGPGYQLSAQLAFAGLTFAAFEGLGARLRWEALRQITAAHLPAVVVFAIAWMFVRHAHPFEFGGFVSWPLNFVVLFWCMERRHERPASSAYIVRFVAAWILLLMVATVEAVWSLRHGQFAVTSALAALGVAAAYLCYARHDSHHRGYTLVGVWTLAWAGVFWTWAGVAWIHADVTQAYRPAALLGFFGVSIAVWELLGTRLQWRHLRLAQCALLPAMLAVAALQLQIHTHPFANAGWAAWAVALAVFYVTLYRQQRDGVALFAEAQHVAMTWLISALPAWELTWQFDTAQWGGGWRMAVWGVIPAAAILWVLTHGQRLWPWSAHREVFIRYALTPLVVVGLAWSLFVLRSPAHVTPFPYFPLLNALDVAQILMLWAIWRWCENAGGLLADAPWRYWKHAVAALGFLWVNAVVLRTIHHWAGVEYRFGELFRSIAVQTSFSLLWTSTAFAMMLIAARNRYRTMWFMGAALLAVVVLKLFVFDLSGTGTIARIVSFMGVGALLMWIGYKVPVPPGDIEAERG